MIVSEKSFHLSLFRMRCTLNGGDELSSVIFFLTNLCFRQSSAAAIISALTRAACPTRHHFRVMMRKSSAFLSTLPHSWTSLHYECSLGEA